MVYGWNFVHCHLSLSKPHAACGDFYFFENFPLREISLRSMWYYIKHSVLKNFSCSSTIIVWFRLKWKLLIIWFMFPPFHRDFYKSLGTKLFLLSKLIKQVYYSELLIKTAFAKISLLQLLVTTYNNSFSNEPLFLFIVNKIRKLTSDMRHL